MIDPPVAQLISFRVRFPVGTSVYYLVNDYHRERVLRAVHDPLDGITRSLQIEIRNFMEWELRR